MKTFESSLFVGKSYFINDKAQLYLTFQPIYKTITIFSDLPNIVSEWEFKGLSNKKFRPPYTTNKALSPKLEWNKCKLRLKFEGGCLKQEDTVHVTPNNIVNLLIGYKLDSWPRDLDTDYTLGGCLFEGVKFSKNADPDEYSYSSFGLGFDTSGYRSLPDGSVGKNVIVFGVDMSSSVPIDNKGRDILILGKRPTQGLNHTLTAEAQYSINFTRPVIKFCLRLHYNRSSRFLFVNATKYISSKRKILS